MLHAKIKVWLVITLILQRLTKSFRLFEVIFHITTIAKAAILSIAFYTKTV